MVQNSKKLPFGLPFNIMFTGVQQGENYLSKNENRLSDLCDTFQINDQTIKWEICKWTTDFFFFLFHQRQSHAHFTMILWKHVSVIGIDG